MPAAFTAISRGSDASAPSEPPPGEEPSQGAPPDVDQTSVPEPAFVTLTPVGAELPPSEATVKEIAAGWTPIFGSALTFRVTATDCGVLDAPGAVTWTAARYVPSARPLVLTVTDSAWVALPA